MNGYCSNSFLRCDNARSVKVLVQTSHYCPKCEFSLIPAENANDSLRLDQKFLYVSLLLMVGLLLILVYIHYQKFV